MVNEEQLLEEIHRDPRRFEAVYEAFYPNIFGYAFRRTADYDAARDIAAETFLKAFAAIGRFRWRNISLLSWLYRIATNELARHHRSRRYEPGSLSRIREEYGVILTDYPTAETERIRLEEELERHRLYLRVSALIRTLDAKYQDVLALRYYERKSIAEIAAILGKNEGTVKSLLSRGVDKLRAHFPEEAHDS